VKKAAKQKNNAGVEMSKYVHRFYTAVSVLAGNGHIKQRLVRAYEDNLAFIDDDDMPSALQSPFADLRLLMNSVDPLNGEGPIRASVRKMSIEQADDCAHQIVDLYGDMIRILEISQEALPHALEEKAAVTPVLVKAN
jgi:hypothetical protein